MSTVLIGQCACGAALTQHHVLFECPLRPQLVADTASQQRELERVIRSALKERMSDENVAERGYN
jgi:hypothetical protein